MSPIETFMLSVIFTLLLGLGYAARQAVTWKRRCKEACSILAQLVAIKNTIDGLMGDCIRAARPKIDRGDNVVPFAPIKPKGTRPL